MDKVPLSKLEHPGDTAMDPASCKFIAAFTRALGAKKVLEFGSGFSTLMMAREMAAAEGSSLLSIDDSPAFSAEAREAYDASGCQAKVEFRVAPLKPRLYGLKLLLSYSLPKGLLEALGPFDLILIDAPHPEHGRESVFYDAFPALANGGYLVMDDANRPETQAYVKAWRAAYGKDVDPIMLEGIGNGLCVIEKVSDARPRFTGLGLADSLRTLRGYSGLLLGKKKE
jgi:predicted O-methyltransferase YrrM